MAIPSMQSLKKIMIVLQCYKVDKCFRITKRWVFACSALVCWEWTEQEKLPPSRCWQEMLAPLMARHRSGTGMGKLFMNVLASHQCNLGVIFLLLLFLLFIHVALHAHSYIHVYTWNMFLRICIEDETEANPSQDRALLSFFQVPKLHCLMNLSEIKFA